MRKNIPILLLGTVMIFMALLGIALIFNNQSIPVTPTALLVTSLFPREADEFFISSVVNNADLNLGITLERAFPSSPDQANNIGFAVFNHTDEPITFPNQGFGLSIFRYDDINKRWKSLPLQYEPYPESKTLPPKLEKWDFEINNGWDILEDETIALGYKQIRLYVSGKGETTNQTYGAYLDVNLSISP